MSEKINPKKKKISEKGNLRAEKQWTAKTVEIRMKALVAQYNFSLFRKHQIVNLSDLGLIS